MSPGGSSPSEVDKSGTSPAQPGVADAGTPATPAVVTGPQFCGMPLTGTSVIFLLDRGDSASEIFDALKQATYAAIASLGPERKFQVLFWDNHTDDIAYPPNAPTYATPENLAACTKVAGRCDRFSPERDHSTAAQGRCRESRRDRHRDGKGVRIG